MTKLLHRLGFVHKKPDTTPGRVDIAKQLSFLQKFEVLCCTGHSVYSIDG